MMSSVETFKIFCGNLSPSTTDDDLHGLFSKFGTVVEAVVKAGKNFGFVHMNSEPQGLKALYRLQGYVLNGEKMVVQRAINSRRAAAFASFTPKRVVGHGVNSMDDFDSYENFNSPTSENGSDLTVNDNVNFSQYLTINSPQLQQNSINPSISPSLQLPPNSEPISNFETLNDNFNHIQDFNNKVPVLDLDASCGICGQSYSRRTQSGVSNSPFCPDCVLSLSKPSDTKYSNISNSNNAEANSYKLNGDMFNGSSFHFNNVLSNVAQSPPIQNIPSIPEICCQCLCSPPISTCTEQNHEIVKEDEAHNILKTKLKSFLEFSLSSLRSVMTMRASQKERMQYTLHSLTKFSEELKLKIEGEELEEAMQQSLLTDLDQAIEALHNINSVTELLTACNKVQSYTQSIATQFNSCLATTAINDAIDAIILKLRQPFVNTNISQLGFSAEEGFSPGANLKEQADKGNYANVLLLYLLCDLLYNRHKSRAENSHSTSLSPDISVATGNGELDINLNPDVKDDYDINNVIETTQAIELSDKLKENYNDNFKLSKEYETPPPALGFGISNFSLMTSNSSLSDNSDDEKAVNGAAKAEEDSKPSSYIDALKKAPKPNVVAKDSASKQFSKTLALPVKTLKFPHCWMTISVDSEMLGRIVFQLRPDKAPKMCENFINLCTGKCGYGYKGTHFFKNGDGFLVGGDVENDDGSGGYSYDNKQKFEADLCPLKDDVGMVRFKGVGTSDNGRGMVGSQFMIWYTQREFKKFSFSLVFGRVVDGLEIVQQIANHNLHESAIKVEQCGAI